MLRVGFVQTEPRFGKKQENFSAVEALLEGVTADLLVLPELFATGYTFSSETEVLELSEEKGQETTLFLQELAVRCKAAVVAGFAESEKGKCYNSAMMADASGNITVYRKIHLFNKEKLWFSPGDRAPEVISVKGVKIGIMICFDWIFPEICRTLALKGAQIIAHPANLVLPWAQKAMVTRCIENRVFAVTANRTGREQRGGDDFAFTGQSQVTGCRGEILATASAGKAEVSIVEIDPGLANDKSVNPYNDLFGDRRSGLYVI